MESDPMLAQKIAEAVEYWTKWLYGALGTLILFLIKMLFSRMKKEKAAREAYSTSQLNVLEDILVGIVSEWEVKGYCPYHVRDRFEKIYNDYITLGGGNAMAPLRNSLFALPLNDTHRHDKEDNKDADSGR